jgi:hypothetical protein
MENAYDSIKKQQQLWALAEQIDFNKGGYVKELRQNLFQDLDKDSISEFTVGKGRELEGHMLALHSSSALVVNFFHWWRSSNNIPKLANALGLAGTYVNLNFEKTHMKPKGIGGIRPHLDIELGGPLKPVAIESKFTEPYHRKLRSLKPAYVGNDTIWGNYKGCKKLAEAIVSGKETFEYLDAPQLLKHIIGLKTDYGENGFELIYLWYDYPSEEAENHVNEMKIFGKYVEGDVNIRDIPYQRLFDSVQAIQDVDNKYVNYLKKRYFRKSLYVGAPAL